ncbi:hypothetical protein DFH28DRAFT_892024 [Melampsora americana]|nr:hypothetical protein DFH28DRAFT_892024 [Melampsora americana]
MATASTSRLKIDKLQFKQKTSKLTRERNQIHTPTFYFNLMMRMMNDGELPRRKDLANLDFGDQDLTDDFRDAHDGTHSSTSGIGHPRGSTPLSILSSRRSTSSRQFSNQSSSSNRTNLLPNMSALLDFLDSDNLVSFNTTFQPSPSRESVQEPTPGPSRINLSPRSESLQLSSSKQSSLKGDSRHSDREATTPPFSPETHNPKLGFPTPSHVLSNHRPSSQRSSRHSNSPRPQSSLAKLISRTNSPDILKEKTSTRYKENNSIRAQEQRREAGVTRIPNAADRMAAAVMEGAPDARWNVTLVDHIQAPTPINPTIRRSKVVEELLQPIQPLVSAQGLDQDGLGSLEDSDLPQSLIEETRGARFGGAQIHDTIPSTFVTPARPMPHPTTQNAKEPDLDIHTLLNAHRDRDRPNSHSNLETEMDDISRLVPKIKHHDTMDKRVTELLSHIRADQVVKTNLAVALADARSEVSALRDEVRLLRIGVQKLTDERPSHNHHSADARLERLEHLLGGEDDHRKKPMNRSLNLRHPTTNQIDFEEELKDSAPTYVASFPRRHLENGSGFFLLILAHSTRLERHFEDESGLLD